MTAAVPFFDAPSAGRNRLNNILSDGNTVASYQPGNFTGTLNASAWTNSIGAAGSLAQATGANQPIILPLGVQPYIWFPKSGAADVLTTPDTASNRFATNFDLDVYCAPDDYTPASLYDLIDKRTGAGTPLNYEFYLNTDGKPHISWTDGGAVLRDVASTAATGFTDATNHYLRVKKIDSGADAVVTFYTSDNGSSWTQLGTPVTQTSGAGCGTATGTVNIGGFGGTGGANTFLGKIYRVRLYNGDRATTGTLINEFNAADWPETITNGATKASSTTGEVWTLNNTGAKPAQIVNSPSLLFDGTAHTMKAAFTLVQPETIYVVGRQIGWTSTHAMFDGNTLATGELIQTTATPQVNITAGSSVAANTNLVIKTYGVITVIFNGASSSLQIDGTTATTGNAGAGNMGGFTLGSNGGDLLFGNVQIKEVLIRSVSDSAATKALIQSLLKAVHGTP